MMILEYENLGLFIKFTNAGYSLTEYKDEATTFGKCEISMCKLIDKQLFGKIDFYRKGHLRAREV